MGKFVAINNNRINIVSDTSFNSKFKVVELPEDLSSVDSNDLLVNYRFNDNKFYSIKNRRDAKEMKIALVGNWKMKCGISTYSENLWAEVAPRVGHVKLFIEYNDNPTSDLHMVGSMKLNEDQVVQCWKRGESLNHLISEIKDYNPDIVWIQHEFGLWSNARYWLSMMTQLNQYRVVVTMHSIFHHKDKTIIEAAIPEIVVHLEGAVHLLKNEKGVPGKVHMIPHGCTKNIERQKLWNFYKSDRTFMQFGFGFRYKGWENAIRAVAILKQKYSDVFFTGLFSESPFATVEHQLYYNELVELIASLDIRENVALIRGYQSDATLDSYLRTNQITLFPYISHPEHEVWGASGAARLAMSRGIPVVSSRVNHFSDLPTIKADSPEEIAEVLDGLFGKWDLLKKQTQIQFDFLQENSWECIANQYVRLFESGS